jgi:hypothetical protein
MSIGSPGRIATEGIVLYAGNIPVEIDEDVREEYWTEIRKRPELKNRSQT